MSLWTRLANSLRGDQVNREIDEELASHLEKAAAQGRDPVEARRALGSPLKLREASRDVRAMAWLDSLRADAVFGWRQLKKNRVTSAAAILSLALAIGACTSAFRLADALAYCGLYRSRIRSGCTLSLDKDSGMLGTTPRFGRCATP